MSHLKSHAYAPTEDDHEEDQNMIANNLNDLGL